MSEAEQLALRAENARLRQTLEFYADPKTREGMIGGIVHGVMTWEQAVALDVIPAQGALESPALGEDLRAENLRLELSALASHSASKGIIKSLTDLVETLRDAVKELGDHNERLAIALESVDRQARARGYPTGAEWTMLAQKAREALTPSARAAEASALPTSEAASEEPS